MENNELLLKKCTKTLTKEMPVLRKMAGLTQTQLGEIMGVSRQTITNIESGKSEMKWFQFLALMFLFTLDVDTADYLKTLEIPYEEIKIWLWEKKGKNSL